MVSDQWPAIEFEERPWVSVDEVIASRSAKRRHRGPYQAAVVPEIAGQAVALPGGVASMVDDASVEIARFDAELGHEIAPFATVLLRSESAASSKIENLTASARAIAEAELHATHRGNARQIVGNVAAMRAAIGLADRLDARSILRMHEALLSDTAPDIAGRWREAQVWIGGGDLGPHGALFVPPHHDRVEAAIADLVAFVGRDDIPAVAHGALAHAQFETVHPFADGNGRTGRALLHAMFRNKGLTRNVTVPVSAGLLTDTQRYFDALTAYRSGDVVPIVEQVAGAAFAALDNGRRLVVELRELRADWDDRIRSRRGANVWRIADLLVRQPVVDAAYVAGELALRPQNVYRSLDALVDAGVLVEFTDKRRHRLWRASEVLDALDRFGARAGRRVRGG